RRAGRLGEGGEAASSTHDAVVHLFDECAPGLRRYVGAFGLTAEVTEDVVQEVFLQLFRHLRLGRSRANLRGWIFRVGHNQALKHREKAARRYPQGGGRGGRGWYGGACE